MPRDNKENNSSHFDRSGYSSNGTYRDARESDTLGRNYHTSSAIYEANPNVMRRQSDEDTESSNKYTSRSRHHQYQYDHRGSTSSKMGNGRGSDCSRRSANHSDNEGSAFAVPHSDKVIALFGAYGVTGHYFLKLALEAGYHVRVLLLPGIDLEDIEGNENLTIVTGTFDDDQKIRRVVRKAAFVVCMLNDCEKSAVQNHNGTQCSNLKFIQQLLPILQDIQLCQVLLYQASAVALDSTGSAPMLSQMFKKMSLSKGRRDTMSEQDEIVKYICTVPHGDDETEFRFNFIITRPSDLLWDWPSRKRLAASKSQPGPFPITNIDLAEFSLNALRNEKLYNTCPYVVQDGI